MILNAKNVITMLLLLTVCLMGFSCSKAYAATVTWTEQPERYYQYDKTPNNLGDKAWGYIVTTDVDSVPASWIKQEGVFIKEISSGGRPRYTKEVIEEPPVVKPDCEGVKCVDDFGVTYDLAKLSEVLKCPRAKLLNGVWVEYEGVQAGLDRCN